MRTQALAFDSVQRSSESKKRIFLCFDGQGQFQETKRDDLFNDETDALWVDGPGVINVNSSYRLAISRSHGSNPKKHVMRFGSEIVPSQSYIPATDDFEQLFVPVLTEHSQQIVSESFAVVTSFSNQGSHPLSIQGPSSSTFSPIHHPFRQSAVPAGDNASLNEAADGHERTTEMQQKVQRKGKFLACLECSLPYHFNCNACPSCGKSVKKVGVKRGRNNDLLPQKPSHGKFRPDPMTSVVRITPQEMLFSVCLFPRCRSFRSTVIFDQVSGLGVCNRRECIALNQMTRPHEDPQAAGGEFSSHEQGAGLRDSETFMSRGVLNQDISPDYNGAGEVYPDPTCEGDSEVNPTGREDLQAEADSVNFGGEDCSWLDDYFEAGNFGQLKLGDEAHLFDNEIDHEFDDIFDPNSLFAELDMILAVKDPTVSSPRSPSAPQLMADRLPGYPPFCPHVALVHSALQKQTELNLDIPLAIEVHLDPAVLTRMLQYKEINDEMAKIMKERAVLSNGRVWFPTANFCVVPAPEDIASLPNSRGVSSHSLTGYGHVELFERQLYCHVSCGRPCQQWRKQSFCEQHSLVALWGFRSWKGEDEEILVLGKRTMNDFHITVQREPRFLKSRSIQRHKILRPDDWMLHLRDGPDLPILIDTTTRCFQRALIMPTMIGSNDPPITSLESAVAFHKKIRMATPSGTRFQCWMSILLTDNTTIEEVLAAKESGLVKAFILEGIHPEGSDPSMCVTSLFNKCTPAVKAMADVKMPLMVYSDVVPIWTPPVDPYEREQVCIVNIAVPLLKIAPKLNLVLAGISTKQAVDFIHYTDLNLNVVGTVAPEHLLYSRSDFLSSTLNPQLFTRPLLQPQLHRRAILEAIRGGSSKLFLGSRSVAIPPCYRQRGKVLPGSFSAPALLPLCAKAMDEFRCLERLQRFVSWNGASFFGVPRNKEMMALVKSQWLVDEYINLPSGAIRPLGGGQVLEWKGIVKGTRFSAK